ncbi:MAG TPA: ABC transporter permease, partial [Actinomycetota bacterium]|nr:ABC transporter permease [Actinomycetota bacterium]
MALAPEPLVGEPPPPPEAAARPRVRRGVVGVGAALLLLVIVRGITHSTELTSSDTFSSALALTVPILFAGLGALYAERVG